MCEGIPRKVNFLIDEAVSTGKGANTMISYVHYYLEHYRLGEQHAHLHTDNCAGKTKTIFFFGTWLTEFCRNFTAQLHTRF